MLKWALRRCNGQRPIVLLGIELLLRWLAKGLFCPIQGLERATLVHRRSLYALSYPLAAKKKKKSKILSKK
jgi:hypothetical protein